MSNDELQNEINALIELLREVDRMLDSNKTWGGMGWVYHPISPNKYLPTKKLVNRAIDKHHKKSHKNNELFDGT